MIVFLINIYFNNILIIAFSVSNLISRLILVLILILIQVYFVILILKLILIVFSLIPFKSNHFPLNQIPHPSSNLNSSSIFNYSINSYGNNNPNINSCGNNIFSNFCYVHQLSRSCLSLRAARVHLSLPWSPWARPRLPRLPLCRLLKSPSTLCWPRFQRRRNQTLPNS